MQRELPHRQFAYLGSCHAGQLDLPGTCRVVRPAAYDQPMIDATLFQAWTYSATEVVAPDTHGRMQQLAASPAWFVIGDDGGGNLHVVDLAPGPQGTFGQVLFVDHEMSAGARGPAAPCCGLAAAAAHRAGPVTLLAAGLSVRAGWTDTVEVVNGLLGAWQQEPIQVIDVPVRL